MKTPSRTPVIAFLAATVLSPVLPAAVIQSVPVDASVVGVEQISATLTPEPRASSGPGTLADDLDPSPARARFVFDNVFDLTRESQVSFTGNLRAGPGNTATSAFLTMTFDWLAADGSGFQTSTPVPFLWNADASFGVTDIGGSFTIPFSPQQVSIGFFLTGPFGSLPVDGTAILVSGNFTHEALVPEPVHVAGLAGLGLAGFAAVRSRRTAKA